MGRGSQYSSNKRTNLIQSYVALDFHELERSEQARRCYLLNKEERRSQADIARLLNISQAQVSILVREHESSIS